MAGAAGSVIEPIRLTHGLGAEEARRRVEQLAERHGVRVTPHADGLSGGLETSAPLLGTVRARYAIAEDSLELEVVQAPGFLPAGALRRRLEEELARALA
jgi:hypothetical protein